MMTGNVILQPHQECTLLLNGQSTTFTVTHGSFRHVGGGGTYAVDGALGGATNEAVSRYISLRYAATVHGDLSDETCEALTR